MVNMDRSSLAIAILLATFAACSLGYEITAYDNELESKIGPKECAKGSAYWCQDLQTAKKCGAVKHCIQVVWEHKKLPPDNSDICETCKKMVQEARDELMSNTTQELIKEVLEGTCHIYFPIKVIANECIQLVDEFIPELIDMLASRMDPQMVCSVAWLCNSEKMKQLIEDIKIVEETPKQSDSCQDCKNFVNDVIASVNKMGPDAFKQKLLSVCSQLKGYMKEGCVMAVNQNLNQIYAYVTTELKPDEFCAFAAMCIDGLDPVKKSPFMVSLTKINSGDPECDFCVQLITRLKDIVTANSTKAEVREVLLNLCAQSGSYKEQCIDYVNKYFDMIYQFLISEMDANMICKAMDLCPDLSELLHGIKKRPFIAGNDEKPSYENDINRQTPSNVNEINKDAVKVRVPFSKPGMHHHRPPPSPTNCDIRGHNSITCPLCEYVLHQLQQMLMDNATEEQIKKAIENVCDLLPKTIADQCNAFVEQYGDAVLALLAQEVDPSIVCAELGLCNGVANLIPIKESPLITMERITRPMKPDKMQLPLERMFPPTQRFDDNEACLYCQYSMELIHTLLNMNGTKESIILAIDNICHQLPTSWKNRCHTFIDEYAEPILDMLQSENLTEICGILSFCQGKFASNMLLHASAAAKAAEKHVNSDSCEICQVTIEMLSKLLANPDVEKDVVKALEKVCKYVPASMKPQCQSIIEAYGPYVVQLISELADSKQVCQAIALCAQPAGQVHLLGGNKCTYGPDYWCQSRIHARACKAEQHCKQFVWKN